MTDVSGQPLLVMVDLFPNLTTANQTKNSEYTASNNSLLVDLPAIQQADMALWQQLQAVKPELTPTLGALFNAAWTAPTARTDAQNDAAQFFQTTANNSGAGVSNVTCSMPPQGAVDAQVVAGPAPLPPTLFLSFLLPGCSFHFNSGPLGAAWKLDFDLAIVLSTPVPPPFKFVPVVNAQLSNAQMHTDNVGAELDEFFDDLITDLGNFFTQSSQWVSDVDWDEQLIQQKADNADATVPPAIAKPLESLFTQLNGVAPAVVGAGFTECAFEVVNHQLVLTVTHPRDPGPQLQDTNNPPPPFFKVPATLSADASQAVPGTQLHLVGFNFPIDTSTELKLQWNNTTSGNPTAAQINYNNQTYTIPTPAAFNGTYTYATGQLPSGTPVSFEARCGDKVSWSDWSDVLVISTAATNLADIQLVPAPGNPSTQSFDLGTTPLSETSSNFADAVTIPTGVPDGAYNLVASTGGQVIAETPIMIVSILAPTVDIIDPVTNIVEDSPIYGGLPFTLRGEAFPDGPVTVAINGATVATPTAVSGRFTVPLTTPGDEWTVGVFPLTATSGAETATLDPPLFLEGAPQ
jgi:hypothetical protein